MNECHVSPSKSTASLPYRQLMKKTLGLIYIFASSLPYRQLMKVSGLRSDT